MTKWLVLGWSVVALIVSVIVAFGQLPPPEAFDDSPGYGTWRVTSVVLSPDGEAATVRLRHPYEEKIVAVLHYRLIYSGVFEVPNGTGGVAPAGP